MFRLFENAVDPFRHDDLSAPPRRVLPFLVAQFRPLRPVLVASLLATVVGAGVEVWLIGYAGRLVDTLTTTDPTRMWRAHGVELAAVAALVLLVRPLLHLLNEGLDDLAFRPNALTHVLWRTHRHVSRQSVGWFRAGLSGRIATWVREGASAAMTATYVVVHTLTYVFTYIVGSVWLMGSVDPRLMLPLGLWIVLYAALMSYVVPRYRRASGRQQDADSALTGLLVDSYANIDTLALLDTPADADREVFAAARRARLRVERLEVTMNVGMVTLSGVLMVGLIGYGIVLWQAGAAPIGLIAAALALTFRITAMAEWLLDGVSALFGSLGTLGRALSTVAQPLAVADRPDAGDLVVGGGAIRFREVSHHYGKDGGGLDRLSLEIAAGERVGLVGRSGAGKSTLVNLVLRFFDPEAGTVEIDGQDIAAVTQRSLRRQIAVVTQEAALLHRSVRDNIGSPTSDDAAIVAAARRAAAHGFVVALSDQDGRTGYHAHVGERGVTLSGGQRQRIVLARALHKDAPILLLDEATSALDSEVEAAIHDTFDEVTAGRTVIAIAHRLSTIARMDRIVVLDAGRVVEDGTHAELLARDGLYAALWAQQSGGFLGG
ncbi:multidrug ABC transporter ATP-binding protein [Longispora fulva]|uniref:ATP-binding cassette subfamily B multidrug efflux pump n=1 Tax=Longispora fulva TaxID=619741 RepID=A0A8J7KER5_9ACTN|nr:ABC transporter ATP-binding protein [Longispora fulva]MBG6135285.1 ATP-binding cassette subfamily B multidrug efflux pump [Longispora fulva]GIG56476.1 multidrug ABC transporter ATP-binding protein [Longispora fulva]